MAGVLERGTSGGGRAASSGGRGTATGARAWWAALAALAAVRAAIPLAALAAEGSALPGQPRWDYRTFEGDANGYHAAAREAVAAAGRIPELLAGVAALALVAVLLGRRLRGTRHAWLGLVAPAAAVSLGATLVVAEMEPSGAAVVGWSLVWGAGLAPFRLLGSPSLDLAFGVGLALSAACLAAATVATAYVGLYATGRRAVGLLAAALFAVWPLVTGTMAGERAWENGSWSVDVGLHLYTEPLSTALGVVAVALLLRPRRRAGDAALAGLAAGFAAVVKLSNGLVAAALVPLVALRSGARAAVAYAVAGLVWLPPLAAHWSKGYVEIYDGGIAAVTDPWGLAYVDDAWTDSLLFTPRVLLLLAPLLLLGAVAVRDRLALAFVLAPVAVNVGVYSLYSFTPIHPRFLYAALPFVLVLEAAGAVLLVERAAALRARRRPAAA